MNKLGQYLSSFYKNYQDFVNISLLIILSFIVFYNSLGSYFSEVDDLNSLLHGKRNFGEIFVTETYGYHQEGNYRPIEVLSHQFDRILYGDNSLGRHITNLIIHIFNAMLVYLLVLYLTKQKTISLIAGLLFAVHIIHSNSLPPVAWISGRVDPFVTFFYLITLILFIRFLSNHSILIYLSSFVTFIFALWSKEMAFTVPIIILLYLILFPNNKDEEPHIKKYETFLPGVILSLGVFLILSAIIFNPGFAAKYLSSDGTLLEITIKKINSYQTIAAIGGGLVCIIFVILKLSKKAFTFLLSIRYSIPYFIIFLFYCVARLEILGGIGGNYESAEGENIVFQLGIDSFMRDIFALAGLFLPVGSEYNITIFELQLDHTFIFFVISIFALIVLILIGIRLFISKSKLLTFFYLWVFITLIPVHNALIASGQFQSRYLYLPSVGFCIFISILFYKLTGIKSIPSRLTKGILTAVILFIIVLNSFLIIKHNEKLIISGNIMHGFVLDMKKYQSQISGADNLNFIIFPFSPINSMHALFTYLMLQEPLNFSDNEEGYTKRYNYSMLLLTPDEQESKINLTLLDERNFIIDEVDAGSYFLIPNKLTIIEERIQKIYKERPHARLQLLFPEGQIKETKNAVIKVLKYDKESNKMKLGIELKEQTSDKIKNGLFFIYYKGHFQLINKFNENTRLVKSQ